MSISVVVPVYNSQLSLHELAIRVKQVVSKLTERYELILVNDGSQDKSWGIIDELTQMHDWIVGINLMRNYGQHNALLCGIRQARHDIIVTIDDDLQNPPEEIIKLVRKLEEGFDVVYGTPFQEKHGLWRDIASKITKLALQNAMGAKTARSVSAFRVFRAEMRDAFSGYKGSFVSIDVLLTWGSTKFSTVVVQHDERHFGTSNYTFTKLVTHALNMVTGFSVLPLQIASVIGFTFTIFGICVLFWTIGRSLIQGVVVPGFPFLASIIAIFSGAQLFALGIIGEYLARIHFRTMNIPPYTVRRARSNSLESARESFEAS